MADADKLPPLVQARAERGAPDAKVNDEAKEKIGKLSNEALGKLIKDNKAAFEKNEIQIIPSRTQMEAALSGLFAKYPVGNQKQMMESIDSALADDKVNDEARGKIEKLSKKAITKLVIDNKFALEKYDVIGTGDDVTAFNRTQMEAALSGLFAKYPVGNQKQMMESIDSALADDKAGEKGIEGRFVIPENMQDETPRPDKTLSQNQAPAQASPATTPASPDPLRSALEDPALDASISAMNQMLRQAQDNSAAASRGEIDDPTKMRPPAGQARRIDR